MLNGLKKWKKFKNSSENHSYKEWTASVRRKTLKDLMKVWRSNPQGHFKNYKLALLEAKHKEIRGGLKTLAHYSKH